MEARWETSGPSPFGGWGGLYEPGYVAGLIAATQDPRRHFGAGAAFALLCIAPWVAAVAAFAAALQ